MDCGPLDPPANGMVNTMRGTTLGNVATYTCDTASGFVRVGMLLRVCQLNGQWSGSASTCRRELFRQ